MDSEKAIEKKLREKVQKELKGLCLKLHSQFFTGLPDRMILLPGGEMFFVEVKTTGEQTKPRQKVVIRQLRKLGFRVEVIDRLEQVNKIFE